MARKLYIVRHANTFDKGDVVRRVGARTDLPLSASGRKQSERLARYFAQEGVAFCAAVSSPLARARETAEIVLQATRRETEIEPAPFLREIDYGPDENQPEKDVIARVGARAMDRWEKESVPPEGWICDPAALGDAWRQFFAECQAREGDGPILAVTSNGVARFALDGVDKRCTEFSPRLRTGAFAIIQLNEDGSTAALCWDVRPDD